jgi:hypothetical protein
MWVRLPMLANIIYHIERAPSAAIANHRRLTMFAFRAKILAIMPDAIAVYAVACGQTEQ